MLDEEDAEYREPSRDHSKEPTFANSDIKSTNQLFQKNQEIISKFSNNRNNKSWGTQQTKDLAFNGTLQSAILSRTNESCPSQVSASVVRRQPQILSKDLYNKDLANSSSSARLSSKLSKVIQSNNLKLS